MMLKFNVTYFLKGLSYKKLVHDIKYRTHYHLQLTFKAFLDLVNI